MEMEVNANSVRATVAAAEVHEGSAFGPTDETTALGHSACQWYFGVRHCHPLSAADVLLRSVALGVCWSTQDGLVACKTSGET